VVASDPATLTVVGANAAPSFTPGTDVVVDEDAGAVSRANWATDITPGCEIEASQTLWFVVENDNAALFAVPPALSPDGTLTFTPAPAACGMATVTVVLKDDGGTGNGGKDTSDPVNFTITVVGRNDCPDAEDQAVVAVEGSSLPITLNASDEDVNGCGDGTASGTGLSHPSTASCEA